MWKPLAAVVCSLAVGACSPTTAPVRSSPERVIYDYHWPGQIETISLDANRYCGRFDREASLERQTLLTLEYVCK